MIGKHWEESPRERPESASRDRDSEDRTASCKQLNEPRQEQAGRWARPGAGLLGKGPGSGGPVLKCSRGSSPAGPQHSHHTLPSASPLNSGDPGELDLSGVQPSRSPQPPFSVSPAVPAPSGPGSNVASSRKSSLTTPAQLTRPLLSAPSFQN